MPRSRICRPQGPKLVVGGIRLPEGVIRSSSRAGAAWRRATGRPAPFLVIADGAGGGKGKPIRRPSVGRS